MQRRFLKEEDLSLKKALRSCTHGMKAVIEKASEFHTSKVSEDVMTILDA